MRAVVCHELGSVDQLVVEERPTPDPGPSQVLVAVQAAGTSYVDALQVTGRYQIRPQPPYTPGGECAGVIEAIGDGVEGWRVGDRVVAMTGGGAMASHILLSDRQLVPLPPTVDTACGGSFAQVYGTAWFALRHRTAVNPGETMLVTGAGGGVGLAAIDVARSLGAEVIAVASSEEKRRLAIAAGARAAIDPMSEDVKTRARELTDGKGVDVVYDVVGGETAEAALRALRFDGRFVVIGFTAGIPRVPLNLVLLNNRTVIGVEWGGWVMRNHDANAAMLREILDAIADGRLHPVVPDSRPLEEVAAVFADLLERRAVGKTVLVP